jgi:P-type E1-E2 ATPase
LIGGTAVEDRLQDEVAETIVMMKNAGIKFFILTGDKKQTAVSIGRSCGLIDPNSKIFSYPE